MTILQVIFYSICAFVALIAACVAFGIVKQSQTVRDAAIGFVMGAGALTAGFYVGRLFW